jgi:MoaA/NifB/PqqE/SkfB family radical SAM enzyme
MVSVGAVGRGVSRDGPPTLGTWDGTRPNPALPTVCAAPSVMMDFDPYGNVLACCANVLYPLGNVRRSSLSEIWRGERAGKLRAALRRGDLGYGCGNCRHRLLFHGGEVARDVYDDYVPTPVPTALEDGDPLDLPAILGFSLHNTCNLECIMCGADSSSRIRRRRSSLAPLPHAYGEEFFEQLDPYLDACRWADFRGGEPFLVPEHFTVWDRLAAVNPTCPVSVTTNATVWNERVEQVLDTFDTSVVLSFDGVSRRTFERVRSGADFDTVIANLDRFQAYCRDRGTQLQLSYCLLQQNWFEFADVLRFAESRSLSTSVHTVLEPGFGVQRLDTAELARVVAQLESEDATVRSELRLNLGIWDRELERLRSELRTRRAGTPDPWIGEPPRADAVDHVVATMRAATGTWAAAVSGSTSIGSGPEMDELAAWSDTGLVGQVDLDRHGRIISADLHGVFGALGTDAPLGAATFGDLLRSVERASGSRLWVSEEFVSRHRAEHLLLFGHEDRERHGLLLRTIAVPGPLRTTRVVLATDSSLLVDRGLATAVPAQHVELGRHRPDHAIPARDRPAS